MAREEWLTNALESVTLYSWAQNNHWFTNYKADQPGVTTFRYWLRPHAGGYTAGACAQFGMQASRPLIVAAARGWPGSRDSRLELSTADVLLETLKVSEDGRALVLRLFGVTGVDREVRLKWHRVKPTGMALTDLTEQPRKSLGSRVSVPAYGIVSVRAELP